MITYIPNLSLGMDPELFIAKDGQIVGSERVIPEKGIPISLYYSKSNVVRDGVQVELQPQPSTCRESLATNLKVAFMNLQNILHDTGVVPVFDTVVEVGEQEMSGLSEKSRILGCTPSRNSHDREAKIVIAKGYKKRSAGGHIHMGLDQSVSKIMPVREKIVPLLDILVGNTSVLLDRDPHAAERRQVYGRAGEYRLPKHGLEYRTLSNYWLRSYPLTSMVLGLCRMACSAIHTDLMAGQVVQDYGRYELVRRDHKNVVTFYNVTIPADQNLERHLLSLIEIPNIIKAINHNDKDLAWENYLRIKPWIQEHATSDDGDYAYPLHNRNLEDFEHFVSKPITEWFPDDPMTHWLKLQIASTGWEKFLLNVVRPDRFQSQRKEA